MYQTVKIIPIDVKHELYKHFELTTFWHLLHPSLSLIMSMSVLRDSSAVLRYPASSAIFTLLCRKYQYSNTIHAIGFIHCKVLPMEYWLHELTMQQPVQCSLWEPILKLNLALYCIPSVVLTRKRSKCATQVCMLIQRCQCLFRL